MGHLEHLKDEYRNLVQRLESAQVSFPEPREPRARQAWRDILEILYTPEDAALCARLPVLPATLERLVRELALPPEALSPRLEALCNKGLVMDIVHPRTGEISYVLAPPVVGFLELSMMRTHDAIPKKRLAEALEAYHLGDDTFAREVFGGETVIGRAVVHETTFADDSPPDVLAFERATEIVRSARSRAVGLCFCRHSAEHLGKKCGAPDDNCLSLNGGADFAIRRGFARAVDETEALEILERARAFGLVHIVDNVKKEPSYLCNCCGCCCMQLKGIHVFGLRSVNPSGFTPRIARPACKGCSRCARACPVAAITMRPERSASKSRCNLLPAFDLERCIGCGVCADACRNGAMKMIRSNTPVQVPASTLERVVRMATERGHLALFLAEHASKRPGLLRDALRAIFALSPVEKALANKQLRSRFIARALGRIPDPLG